MEKIDTWLSSWQILVDAFEGSVSIQQAGIFQHISVS